MRRTRQLESDIITFGILHVFFYIRGRIIEDRDSVFAEQFHEGPFCYPRQLCGLAERQFPFLVKLRREEHRRFILVKLNSIGYPERNRFHKWKLTVMSPIVNLSRLGRADLSQYRERVVDAFGGLDKESGYLTGRRNDRQRERSVTAHR